MLVEQRRNIDYIKDVENLMDRRFQGARFKDKSDSSGWWILPIRISMDKKKNLMKQW